MFIRHGIAARRVRPAFVPIRLSRTFPYPLDACFAWLTDYRDDDPARTTAVVKRRPVLSRSADKVVMEGELELLGARGVGKVEVALHPPDHYVATIVEGSGKGSVYDYKLAPIEGGTPLDVTYNVRVKRWKSRLRVLAARPVAPRSL